MHFNKFLYAFLLLCPFYLAGQVDNYSAGEQGQKMDWLLYYLDKNYVDSIDNKYMADVAIRAIVKELDPYSSYQSKEEADKQRENDKGYTGKSAGFNFYMIRDTAIVTYVNDGGPADLASLVKGDRILKINGNTAIGASGFNLINDAINLPEINDFDMSVLRKSGALENVVFEKDNLPLLSVTAGYMLSENVGYIKLGRFTLKTMEEFVPTVKYLHSLGMQKMVLDMRGNYGGVKEQAIKLADIFLDEGKVIHRAEGMNFPKDKRMSEAGGIWEKGKLVILQDEKTASACEIFISAMQEWDRAIIVGTSTYGKGLIQQSYKLGDGSTIRLTIGRYYTPTGRLLQRTSEANNDWMTPYKTELHANSMTRDLKVPTSMKIKSMNGREILAGPGGIIPDIFYEWEDNRDYTLLNQLNERGLLYKFATDYTDKNRIQLKQEYNTVKAYVDDRIREAYMLKDLREYLSKEASNLVIPHNFPETVIWTLKSWVAAQTWHDNAYWEVENGDDTLLYRAMEVMDGTLHEILGVTY